MNETAPQQGDIRLFPIDPANLTRPCDDVHMGGVEFFNDGQWGGICASGDSWTVDARVICRQLGFPFGSLVDSTRIGSFSFEGPSRPNVASNVLCKGTEERLDECFFPDDEDGDSDVLAGPDIDQLRPCVDDRLITVLCRRFPLEGAIYLRQTEPVMIDHVIC